MEFVFGASILKKVPLDSSSELALIERCQRQDMEAFGQLIDAYQNRVFGFARRLVGDADEAADIAQEVFVKAFQAFSRFDGRSSVRTWLFRIAHNLCIDRLRKLERAPLETRIDARVEGETTFEIMDSRWDPEASAIDSELAAAVEVAVGSLSEKLRSVLLLHDKEDMAYDEIASALNLPVGTVKSRLFLARAHLQQALAPYLRGEVTS